MASSFETVSLTVACTHCGGSSLALEAPGGDEAMTRCRTCGEELGAWAEVKEQARAAMFDAMRDDFAGLRQIAVATPPPARASMPAPAHIM